MIATFFSRQVAIIGDHGALFTLAKRVMNDRHPIREIPGGGHQPPVFLLFRPFGGDHPAIIGDHGDHGDHGKKGSYQADRLEQGMNALQNGSIRQEWQELPKTAQIVWRDHE